MTIHEQEDGSKVHKWNNETVIPATFPHHQSEQYKNNISNCSRNKTEYLHFSCEFVVSVCFFGCRHGD
jgi:hypothetical protein